MKNQFACLLISYWGVIEMYQAFKNCNVLNETSCPLACEVPTFLAKVFPQSCVYQQCVLIVCQCQGHPSTGSPDQTTSAA